jgi:DNA-binding beta-propeller fold protein YncE
LLLLEGFWGKKWESFLEHKHQSIYIYRFLLITILQRGAKMSRSAAFTIVILILLVLIYPQTSKGQDRYVHLYSFPEGPGFDSPYDLAVDGSGNIYVADTNNHRIQKFTRSGELITSWGTWGVGVGEFQKPWGIAVDKSGNVYVADSDNCRIQKFNSNGGFLSKFGKRGSAEGDMTRPNGVAVDNSGNIYVADTDNHRIEKFNSNGAFIKQWGSNGSSDGQTPYPEGIAVDSKGNVYLADAYNGRIQKFDSNGNFLKKWGKQGFKDGEFIGPRGVAVDRDDYVYVSDTRNNRIQKFNSEGDFIIKLGSLGTGEGQFNNPRGIDISPFGDMCVVDWNNNRIQVLDSTGGFFAKWGISGSGIGQFLSPKGVALDPSGNIYVADTNNHRIQKMDRYGHFIMGWGIRGSSDGQFQFPSGIIVDKSGNIYVSDLGNNRIQKFGPSGNPITKWGSVGTGDGQFMSPSGVAVDALGNVYVADWFNNRIQKFDSSGNYIKQWGSLGGGDGQFDSPRGVAVDLSGNVYVADTSNYRIQKFTSNGNFLGKWGSRGSGDGQLYTPWCLTTDAAGNVYVSDYGNHRIQKFNSNGVFVAKWGAEGDAISQLRYPNGIAIDNSGSTVYVADTGNQCIKAYIQSAGNVAPIANPKILIGFEDTPIEFTLTGRDPDGSFITFRITSQPTHGTLTGNTPNLIYTPNPDFTGNDSFTFIVSDGYADSPSATVQITIGAVNDPPSADPIAVETDEDKSVEITLTGNDPDNDPITFRIVDEPQNGDLSGEPPNITYTPKADFSGTDSFTYVSNDGFSDSETALVNITIRQIDDPPIADSNAVTVDEDSFVQITLTGKDPEGQSVTFKIVDKPKNGTLSDTPPNVIYTPKANFNGTDKLTFKVNDGVLDSELATITITVKPVNDKPVANSMSVTTQEDTFLKIILTASDIDAVIQTLRYEIVNKPSHGTLSATPPYVVYTPQKDFYGSDSFTFVAWDAFEKSEPATVTITITPVNDPPSTNSQIVNMKEDTPTNITLTGSDPENDELNYKIVSNPSNGKLNGTAPKLEYVPNPNFFGDDSFTFSVKDGFLESNVGKITIKVESVNDPPIANTQSVTINEDAAINITLTGSDIESDTLIYNITKYPPNGYLSGNPPNMQYKPNFGFFGTDTFAFSVNDGTTNSEPATITIIINKINEPPFAISQSFTTDEDTPLNIVLTGTDPENDKLTFKIVAQPLNGTLKETDKELIYTPKQKFNGNDSFTFLASDEELESKPATVNIKIKPVNDPPISEPQTVNVDENSQVKITLIAKDPEKDKITFEIASKPSNGTLEGTPPELVYKPNKGFSGEDSFTFTANDATLESDPANIRIIVRLVNNIPVAISQIFQAEENKSVDFKLLGTDPDEDILTYKIMTFPLNGTLSGKPPELTYQPKGNFVGIDSFTG